MQQAHTNVYCTRYRFINTGGSRYVTQKPVQTPLG
jgi:hypothetical protein